MLKERAMQWADALESGEFPQCQGTLHQSENTYGRKVGYCCLGVLSELAHREGVVEKWEKDGFTYYGDSTAMESNLSNELVSSSGLTKAVREWSGMQSDDGSRKTIIDGNGPGNNLYPYALMSLNDSQGKSFVEIAAVIRAEYADL